eukprot:789557-Karenia_brevis.AAC.1
MASLEERVSVLEELNRRNIDELNKWREGVDKHMSSAASKMSETESRVQELVYQFEQMGHKGKEGTKGLKKAFGSKGSDLKPEKFEKEKPGTTFKSWSTS